MPVEREGEEKGTADGSGAQVTITRGEEEVWEGGRPESGSGCVKLDFPDSIWGRFLPASWEPGRGQRGHEHPSQKEGG